MQALLQGNCINSNVTHKPQTLTHSHKKTLCIVSQSQMKYTVQVTYLSVQFIHPPIRDQLPNQQLHLLFKSSDVFRTDLALQKWQLNKYMVVGSYICKGLIHVAVDVVNNVSRDVLSQVSQLTLRVKLANVSCVPAWFHCWN